MAIGRVISLDSGVYKILGENNEEILLKARGSLRHKEVSKDSSFNKSTNIPKRLKQKELSFHLRWEILFYMSAVLIHTF